MQFLKDANQDDNAYLIMVNICTNKTPFYYFSHV